MLFDELNKLSVENSNGKRGMSQSELELVKIIEHELFKQAKIGSFSHIQTVQTRGVIEPLVIENYFVKQGVVSTHMTELLKDGYTTFMFSWSKQSKNPIE